MNDQNNNQERDLGAKEATSLPRLCAGSWGEQELVQSRTGSPGRVRVQGWACVKSREKFLSKFFLRWETGAGFEAVSVSTVIHRKWDFFLFVSPHPRG